MLLLVVLAGVAAKNFPKVFRKKVERESVEEELQEKTVEKF